jgi:hypothetical protein
MPERSVNFLPQPDAIDLLIQQTIEKIYPERCWPCPRIVHGVAMAALSGYKQANVVLPENISDNCAGAIEVQDSYPFMCAHDMQD